MLLAQTSLPHIPSAKLEHHVHELPLNEHLVNLDDVIMLEPLEDLHLDVTEGALLTIYLLPSEAEPAVPVLHLLAAIMNTSSSTTSLYQSGQDAATKRALK